MSAAEQRPAHPSPAAVAAVLGLGPQVLDGLADRGRVAAIATEQWSTRMGSTLSIDRGDHVVDATYDATGLLLGVSVVVHDPAPRLVTALLEGLVARLADTAGAVTAWADDDELVVLDGQWAVHVLRRPAGGVGEVQATTPVPQAQRALVTDVLAPVDAAAVRAFLAAS